MGRGWAIFSLVVFGLFTLGGAWLSFDQADPKWIGVLTMGIAGLLVAGGSLRDDRKNRKLHGVTAFEVPGGVPIRASRWQQRLMLVTGLMMFGVPALVFDGMPVLVAYGASLMATVTLGALVLSFLGLLPQPSLTFTPSGLRFTNGRSHEYEIDWDNIAAVAPGTYVNNEAVFLALVDPSRVKLGPKLTALKFMKSIAWCRGLVQCDVLYMARQFGLTGGELAAAILTYVQDPAKRAQFATTYVSAGR